MTKPTPRTKPIDLSKCKVGQRVKLRNKLVVIFTGKSTCSRFPFKYEHPDHGEVTVTTGGQVLTSCAAPEDIVALLPLPKKAKKKKRVKHIGKWAARLTKQANNPREVAFAKQWQKENEDGHVLHLLMNTPQSPFAAIQELQEEQREGWVPDPKYHPHRRHNKRPDAVRDNLKAQLTEKDAKIAEQAAQIVALREALIGCSKRLQIEVASSARAEFPESARNAPSRLDNVKAIAAALSTPAPPVVLLEDVRPLVDQFQALLKSALPHPVAHPSMHTAWSTANAALLLFTTSHPQP